MHSYDSHGWLSLAEISNRTTEVEPPSHGAAPVVGEPWPNFTGVEWVMVAYSEPVIPPAQTRRRLTKLEFFDRFFDSELVNVYTAAETSAEVRVWLDKLKMATPDSDGTSINLDDPRTVGGVNAMEFGGLIGVGRAAVILA